MVLRIEAVEILEAQRHRESEAAYEREVGYDRLLVRLHPLTP
jgi:hypothetical protein